MLRARLRTLWPASCTAPARWVAAAWGDGLLRWASPAAAAAAAAAGLASVYWAASFLPLRCHTCRSCKPMRSPSRHATPTYLQVGFVSKSGGMSNELYNVIARAADGIFEGG